MIDGLLLLGGGIGAGLFGSLLGLGGGILIVPLLTLGFGVTLIKAVGVSLVCVIVTSGAAASVYLDRHVANLRLGMSLELFTATGAMAGGLIAFLLPEQALQLIFAGLLVYVAATMARRREAEASTGDADGGGPVEPVGALEPEGAVEPAGAVAAVAASQSGNPTDSASRAARRRRPFRETLSGPGYEVRHLRYGILGSLAAGVISALLGIGGGLIKVPVMHVVMGVPLRVATATSNLMIGITASASAIIYLLRGGIDPYAAAPTAIGVFVGATIGSRVAHRIDHRILRGLFVVILLYTAWQMLQRGLS